MENTESPDVPQPTLASMKDFPGKTMFTIRTKEGKEMIRMWDTGRVEFSPEVLASNEFQQEAVLSFFQAISRYVLIHDMVQMKRDLWFLMTFIQGKGVFFKDASEQLELARWLGEIERRYNLNAEG